MLILHVFVCWSKVFFIIIIINRSTKEPVLSAIEHYGHEMFLYCGQ